MIDLPEGLPRMAVRLLGIAAQRPGITTDHEWLRLVAADKVAVIRLHLAKLRRGGFLFPASPPWLVLTPGFQYALENKPPTPSNVGRAITYIVAALRTTGPIDRRQFLDDLPDAPHLPELPRGSRRTRFIDQTVLEMRNAGVLYSARGLVLTDKGVRTAKHFGFAVEPQELQEDIFEGWTP